MEAEAITAPECCSGCTILDGVLGTYLQLTIGKIIGTTDNFDLLNPHAMVDCATGPGDAWCIHACGRLVVSSCGGRLKDGWCLVDFCAAEDVSVVQCLRWASEFYCAVMRTPVTEEDIGAHFLVYNCYC